MPLRRPRFSNAPLRRLLAGFGLLNAAEWGFIAAFSVHAFRVGGALYVGLIGLRFLAGAASSAVLAPMLAGRRGVLSQIALARGLLLGAAATLALEYGGFLLPLVFVVADSIVAGVYRPAQSRLLPALARSPDELMRAVAGTSMAKTLGQAGGALIGGGAVAFISPGATMAGEAAMMLLAVACTLGIGRAPVLLTRAAEARRLRDGLAAFPSVLGDTNAWPLVWASVLRTLVRGLWGALLVVVVLHMLHAGNSSVGLMQAAAGLGAVLAVPVTAAQIGRARLAIPCVLSFVAAGIAIGLISVRPPLLIVAVLVCAWGGAMALADSTSLSLLHRLLSTEVFSRTVAVMESLKLVSEAAGALLAPALLAVFGLRSALLVAGLPLPALMITTWVRVRRSDELAAGQGAVVALLHRVGVLRALDMASLEQLGALAEHVEVPSGAEPITQGAQGDHFYVIESGDAEVLINGVRVREIGPGDGFGERALLRDTPRTATVRALSEMRLLAVERDAFLSALTGEAGIGVEQGDLSAVPLVELLPALPAFDGIGDEGLRRLARGAQRKVLATGTVVLEPGDQSDAVYVLLNGRAELRQGELVAAVFLPGDAVGELGVLHGTPCPGRVAVTERTVVDVLLAAAVLAELGGQPVGRA